MQEATSITDTFGSPTVHVFGNGEKCNETKEILEVHENRTSFYVVLAL